ncbi:MAG TPA: large conductance mechanosensitive channel protein MscL [Micropepsaceae bacterium]|nr:large conductance mechanosensitive channel protein MscL [Micropepsaceae bacterium]
MPEIRAMRIFQEFKTFAMRGNAIDLAVGVVIGAAFTTIVNSLVKDIINPPLGLLLGGIDFSNFFVVLKGASTYPTLKAAQDAGAVTIGYGLFINSVTNFLIVAFVVFMLVRQINRLAKPPPAPEPPTPADVLLLREIRDLLKERQGRAS